MSQRVTAFVVAHRGTLKFILWTAFGGAVKAVLDQVTSGHVFVDPGQAAIAGAVLRYLYQISTAILTGSQTGSQNGG